MRDLQVHGSTDQPLLCLLCAGSCAERLPSLMTSDRRFRIHLLSTSSLAMRNSRKATQALTNSLEVLAGVPQWPAVFSACCVWHTCT